MYDEVLKIPLLFHAPGLISAKHIQTLSDQLDIAPTILDLLGFKDIKGYRGHALSSNDDIQKVTFSSCVMATVCLARIDEKYKYIYYFGDKKEGLFAYREDPAELRDLAQKHPKLIEKFRKETLSWYSKQRSTYHNYYSATMPDYLSRKTEAFNVEKMPDFTADFIKKTAIK
jgi:arylsulfatase A-like enzyme